ncbi:predicted protein [Nematostella vectensis]|uniref:Uncharacterized protein n=1 Tax=Nematostella vectensis TaxID=45351 RepID=A7SWK7_NEMVE|nr:predicted protein [Nematostella vectensis]|eukprot:XP_001624027.1 predicted protein [Nematostella vectensis]
MAAPMAESLHCLDEKLRNVKKASVETFKNAVRIRRDEVYERLSKDLEEISEGEIQWHSTCYSSYTSEHNLRHCHAKFEAQARDVKNRITSEPTNSTRSSTSPIDLSKCFICGNRSYKKDKRLLNIATNEASLSLRQAATSKGDEKMLRLLDSVRDDLCAADGRYHKNCHGSYVSKERGVDGSSYSKQRLKLRLKHHFEDRISFHQQPSNNKPEIIFSSQISLIDALCAAAQSKSDSKTYLIDVARYLRSEIKKCDGISFKPLNVNDVSLDSARIIIPDSLYWVIRLVLTADEFEFKRMSPSPWSKQIVSLLNRMGHSSSYDDLKAVDTSLAMEEHADNNDLNEETLDGKNTTHATTMVVYQRKVFGPDPPPIILADHSSRRRSLPESTNLYELLECPCYGRRPALNEHIRKVKNEWFSSELDVLVRALREDEIWLLLRMDLTGRTPAAVMKQTLSGWSGFNTILYPDLPLSSKIGYCPMIDGASTEFSTVYTVLKHAQKVSAVACQEDTVITFDLAIYIKAKQIQLRYQEEFANTVIRLGGFHIALNFLSLLGKKFASSGLDDLLIESGVYAAGTTSALLKGKSYNRGIRAHKLSMEALHRMMWSAYAQWCKDCEDSGLDEKMISRIEESREAILSRDNTSQNLEVLECDIEKLAASLGKFKEEASLQSKTFDFWMRYMSMVKLLLQFIKAERTGNWELHLASTAAMIPHFFSMDRPNYSSRSGQPFSQVWTDMALEQSVNADSKSKGGIVGISQNPAALQRWFLTSHERASVTTALKDAYSAQSDHTHSHKELSSKRIARDEADVNKLVNCFASGLMNNPFELESDALVNFATGVVLPTEVAKYLMESERNGQEQMAVFVKERINSSEVRFWDPIPKLKVKTFDTVTKRVQVKATNEKLVDRCNGSGPMNAACCNEVHLVFDQYWEMSIKAGERSRRAATSTSLEVQVCLLHSPHFTRSYGINGRTIQCCEEERYLGVTVDSDLTWNAQIYHQAAHANKLLGSTTKCPC